MSSNISVCTQALTPQKRALPLCRVSAPKTRRRQRGNPKKLSVQVRKSDFADAVQNNSPWLSSIIKGLEFCFDLF